MSQKPTEKQVLREICGEENVAEEVTLLNETEKKPAMTKEEFEKKWSAVLDHEGLAKIDVKNRKVTTVIL